MDDLQALCSSLSCLQLKELHCNDNPVCSERGYRHSLLRSLPSLRELTILRCRRRIGARARDDACMRAEQSAAARGRQAWSVLQSQRLSARAASEDAVTVSGAVPLAARLHDRGAFLCMTEHLLRLGDDAPRDHPDWSSLCRSVLTPSAGTYTARKLNF